MDSNKPWWLEKRPRKDQFNSGADPLLSAALHVGIKYLFLHLHKIQQQHLFIGFIYFESKGMCWMWRMSRDIVLDMNGKGTTEKHHLHGGMKRWHKYRGKAKMTKISEPECVYPGDFWISAAAFCVGLSLKHFLGSQRVKSFNATLHQTTECSVVSANIPESSAVCTYSAAPSLTNAVSHEDTQVLCFSRLAAPFTHRLWLLFSFLSFCLSHTHPYSFLVWRVEFPQEWHQMNVLTDTLAPSPHFNGRVCVC